MQRDKAENHRLSIFERSMFKIENYNFQRLKIKIFNREICVCALLATNSFMRKKQRRNGVKYEER